MAEIVVNRAPVFTLWGAVVAERLGYAPDEALSLARVMAGLTAQKKGRHLGIFQGKEEKGQGRKARTTGLGEDLWIRLTIRPGRQILRCHPVVALPDEIGRICSFGHGDSWNWAPGA